MKKRILSMTLIVVMLFALLAQTAFAADSYIVVSGVGNKAANTSSTSHQYSKYWQYWSQGASKYSVFRSSGCRLVAHSKMLVECGAASGDTSKFNPDLYYDWAVSKGYWKAPSTGDITELNSVGTAAVAYAKANGVTLTQKGRVTLSGKNTAADAESVMSYIKQGYYVILSCTAHQAYVGRDASLKAGVPIILDSWSSWSYNASQCSKYNSNYKYAYYTGFWYFEKSSPSSLTITNPSATRITTTNAYLSATVKKTASVTVNTCGVYLGTSSSNMVKKNTETVSSAANNKDNGTSFDIYYDLTKELNITLSPSTTYYYKFYCTVGTATYYSDTKTFKTADCAHNWGSGTVTTSPTCTVSGTRTYTCSICGNKKTETIAALGHAWSDWSVTKQAGCTEKGEESRSCSRCSLKETRSMDALGHNFVNGFCTRCGEPNPDGVTDAKLTIYGDPMTAASGSTITVPVLISGSADFAGFTLAVDSSNGLSLTKIEKGTLLKNADGMFTPNLAQKVVNWTSSTNMIASGELLLLTFDVSEDAADGSKLTISLRLKDNKESNFADADEHPVSVKFEDITVTVQNATFGDVNGDGEVDTIDSIRLVRYLVDLVELTPAQKKAADVNHDEDITTTDAIRLAKYLVGLVNTLNTNLTTERATQRTAGNATIQLGSVTGERGEEVKVPVTISDNPGFAGFTFTINVADSLSLKDIEKGTLLQKADGMFTKNVAQSRINWTSSENVTGDGELLVLTIEISADAANGEYPISIALKDGKQSNFANVDETPVAVTFTDGKIVLGQAHEHHYEDVVTPPTCIDQGYTTHTCACGESYIDSYVPALGHDYQAVVTAPTCLDDGYTTFTCARCSDSYVANQTAAAGHNFVNGVCTVCGTADPNAPSANIVSGMCGKEGDNLLWSYNPETGMLTITGSGEMASYDNYNNNAAPWYEYRNAIQTVVVTDGVSSIGSSAFADCSKLKEVSLPAGLKLIDRFAFELCTSLTHVELPSGCTTIGMYAFEACTALTSVTIPDTVSYIGIGAFHNCIALKNVMIPKSVSFIDNAAFGYYYDANMKAHQVQGFTIYGFRGSAAETYAQTYSFKFVPLDNTLGGFADVRETDWFAAAVLWAISQEPAITNGTDATHFSPTTTCTRAEVVQFLWNAAGQPAVDAASNPFSDVKANDWYYKAVMWAVSNGITSGTDATHFAPGKKCTRAEVVAFLRNASTDKEVKTTTNPFTDVKASDWYYNSVLWAVERGITSGTTPTTFAPTKTCTRAEVVQFLYKAK